MGAKNNRERAHSLNSFNSWLITLFPFTSIQRRCQIVLRVRKARLDGKGAPELLDCFVQLA
jgi:hypothetical protein